MKGIKRVIVWLAAALLIAVVGLAVYVRTAPSDPARWHADPLTVAAPGNDGYYLVRPEGGSTTGPAFDMTPAALLRAFDRVAMAQPNVSVLAGSVEEGHITYIARSRIMGFPDYISVKAVGEDRAARLAVFSRLRFGQSDLGVNRDRIERWMAEIPQAAGNP